MMESMNIYLCGVGGQGIALLSEVMIRACLEAGYKVKGCETHGLAQRGGVVVSHLRIGKQVFTPLVPAGQADVVIALERLEGLRGALSMLKQGGTLIYYDTVQQPLDVRHGLVGYPSRRDLLGRLEDRDIRIEAVVVRDIPDPRMQNVALLGRIASMELIPGLGREILLDTLKAVVPEHAIEQNLGVFEMAGSG